MKLSISGAIESDRALGSRVRRASQILERVIGPTSASPSADWGLVQEANGRPAVRLVLSDSMGAHAERRFTRDELGNEDRIEAWLLRMWGDVLQERSHKQLDALLGKTQLGE